MGGKNLNFSYEEYADLLLHLVGTIQSQQVTINELKRDLKMLRRILYPGGK